MGKINWWVVVGFMPYRAWGYLVFFSPEAVFPSAVAELIGMGYVLSLVFLAVVLSLSVKIGAWLRTTLAAHSNLQALGPLLMGLGTAIYSLICGNPVYGIICMVLGSLMTGVGSGVLVLGWSLYFGSHSAYEVGITLICAFVLAGILYVVILGLPQATRLVIAISLPLASGAVASFRLGVWAIEPLHVPNPVDYKFFARKLGVGVALLCLAIGLCQSLYKAQVNLVYQEMPFSMLFATIVAACVILPFMKEGKTVNFGSVYRAAVLFLILGFLAVPLLDGVPALSMTVITSGFVCFQLVLYVLLSDICARLHYDALVVFGLGEGTLNAGIALGSSMNLVLTLPGGLNEWGRDAVSAISVAIMVLMYTYVLQERDIWKIIADRKNQAYNNKPLQERCSQIADTYGLGKREAEVLFLFAQGRTAKRIQEELFISEGTVNTHLSRIYKKINVHTRQELLDVIEDVRI